MLLLNKQSVEKDIKEGPQDGEWIPFKALLAHPPPTHKGIARPISPSQLEGRN